MGDEEAKAWCKVVGIPDLLIHFLKANIFAVAGQDTYRMTKLDVGDMTAFRAHHGLPSRSTQGRSIDYRQPGGDDTLAIYHPHPPRGRG